MFYATIWSLLPPVVAIALALITKEVYSSLFLGIVVGAALVAGFAPVKTLDVIINDGFIAGVADAWNVGIFLFLILLGILVALMNRAGGSAAFGRWAEKHVHTRAGAMLATVLLGVLIFVDESVMSGTELFVRAIPWNYYSLFTLVFVVGLSLMQFDYGPMKLHEMNARLNGDLFTSGERRSDEADIVTSPKGRVVDLVLPVLVLIACCVTGMLYVGGFFSGTSFAAAFAGTDASVGLPWGTLIALVFTVIYYICRGLLSFKEAMECTTKGFIAMVPALLILTLAVTLKNMTGMLGAAEYVFGVMQGASRSLYNLLPAIIFLVGCGLAFSTGTSWGTFGILIPIVTDVFPADSQLLILGVSACLAGAVMGDHCSPISDTTIMASAGAQCDHLNHVSTQIPYVLTVAAISFVSYIIAGFVQNVYICLAIGVALTVATLFVLRAAASRRETANA